MKLNLMPISITPKTTTCSGWFSEVIKMRMQANMLYFDHLKTEVASMAKKRQAHAGRALAVGLAILVGGYILFKILTPKKEVLTFHCPTCGHIVSDKAPYCWYCRIPLDWKTSPITARLKRAPTLVFLGILAFLVLMRYAVYPFTPVSPETYLSSERVLLFFGGIFIRDYFGYFGQTVKS